MKVAIIGSRNLWVENLEQYLPEGTTEIVSGGAQGIDRCAKEFAKINNIRYTEFRPQYALYQRAAPIKRNVQIVEYADLVIAFWDGESRGTKFTIDFCKKCGKEVRIIRKLK